MPEYSFKGNKETEQEEIDGGVGGGRERIDRRVLICSRINHGNHQWFSQPRSSNGFLFRFTELLPSLPSCQDWLLSTLFLLASPSFLIDSYWIRSLLCFTPRCLWFFSDCWFSFTQYYQVLLGFIWYFYVHQVFLGLIKFDFIWTNFQSLLRSFTKFIPVLFVLPNVT